MKNTRFFNSRKYNNKSHQCKQNHIHQSTGEASYCNELYLLQRAGEIKEYISQKRFDLFVNGEKITTHIVDFLVTNKEGKLEVHEYKGFATEAWKIKKKLFEAVIPEIPYIVIWG